MGRSLIRAPHVPFRRALLLVLASAFLALAGDEAYAGFHREIEEIDDDEIEPHTEALEVLAASAEDIVAELRYAREQTQALLPAGPFSLIAVPFDELDAYLRTTLGLNLGASYTALYQGATRDPRPTGAGKFDLFGVWVLLDDGDHSLGFVGFEAGAWQVYTPVSPANLGQEIGSLWPVTNDFSLQTFSLTLLYWEQQLPGGRFAYRIGKIDQDDVFDDYRFKGVDFYFLNQAFSTNPAIALPGKGLGAIAAYDLGGGAYILGGASDAQAQDTVSGFSTLFRDGKIFAAGEIGWTGEVGDIGEGEIHTTVWNSPAYEGQGAGWGIATTAQQELGANVVPFARYAYGAGTATGIRHLATLGIGVDGLPGRDDDVIAAAFAWGAPTDPNARSQLTGEVFYRLQLTPLLQLTPGYQVLVHPATDPTRDVVGIFEVRARVTF